MAMRPMKPCRKCSALTGNKSGMCDAHQFVQAEQKKQADKDRGSAHARGYTSRWTAYSKQYRREHPLCVMCQAEGILKTADVVDHITPHQGSYDLMWNSENHQALCKRHHDTKTATEDGAWGNTKR